jgi:hypothetical protein
MAVGIIQPAFITFTGVDEFDLIPGMLSISARYPVEWGVLVDVAQEGAPLFPVAQVRQVFQSSALRLSAHVCGAAARAIVEGRDAGLDLAGFARVQINHGRIGSTESEIQNSYLFGQRQGIRSALQCQADFPDDARVDWLYDISFGEGVRPTTWPSVSVLSPFCGFSGGLNPDTVGTVLSKLNIASGAAFWIDMESGVRTENRFDLAKCEAVCEIVYGKRAL